MNSIFWPLKLYWDNNLFTWLQRQAVSILPISHQHKSSIHTLNVYIKYVCLCRNKKLICQHRIFIPEHHLLFLWLLSSSSNRNSVLTLWLNWKPILFLVCAVREEFKSSELFRLCAPFYYSFFWKKCMYAFKLPSNVFQISWK